MLWPSFLQAYTYSALELKSNGGWEEDNGHALGITWTDDSTCVTVCIHYEILKLYSDSLETIYFIENISTLKFFFLMLMFF